MKYRKEIDGLRAISVLSVILFHAGFACPQGGFLGVDIFLVISGYLITTIITDELQAGRFSVAAFYERRARRIMPALFAVLIAAVPVSWLLLDPYHFTDFAKSVVAVLTFISNIFFWRLGGQYFQEASELMPLLHTWSLAVEEQFYLFFPLILLLSWRLGRKWIVVILATLSLFSLLAAEWRVARHPDSTFFLLPTRAWELGMGAIVALHLSGRKTIIPGLAVRQIASGLGLLLIFSSIIFFSRHSPLPGIYSLAPTAGAAMIILYGTPDTMAGGLLGHRVLVGVGLISYSAYLWHQPIFAFARIMSQGELSVAAKIALIAGTLGLATLSWRFVEQPFRNKSRFTRRQIFTATAVASLALAAYGFMAALIFRPSSSTGGEARSARLLASGSTPAVYVSNMDERQFVRFRTSYETENPGVLVVGSSRAMQVGKRNFAENTLNLCVSGAAVEDYVTILDMATRRFNPRLILIGADPWLFNEFSGQTRWRSLENEYRQAYMQLYSKNYPESPSPRASFSGSDIVSPVAGLGKLYDFVNVSRVAAQDEQPAWSDKILRDGSRVYNKIYGNMGKEEMESQFATLLDYSMKPYQRSPKAQADFSEMLGAYRKRYQIVLVLSPYHPNLYKMICEQRPVFLEIEKEYRNLAQKLGIPIVGSYNPAECGCGPDDFYDGMHPRDACMERVISKVCAEMKVQP